MFWQFWLLIKIVSAGNFNHLIPQLYDHKKKALMNMRLIRLIYESWLQQKLSDEVIEMTIFLEKIRKSQVNFVFYLFIYYYYYVNDERSDFELNNP